MLGTCRILTTVVAAGLQACLVRNIHLDALIVLVVVNNSTSAVTISGDLYHSTEPPPPRTCPEPQARTHARTAKGRRPSEEGAPPFCVSVSP